MTLASSVTVRGVGLHTGAASVVTLYPAEPGSSVVFRNAAGALLPAQAARVVDTSRCTVLGGDGITVSTVEHLLSAFAGLGVTDAVVEVSGPELPIGDGSARVWVEAIQSVGLTPPSGKVAAPALTEPVVVTGKDGQFIAAYPAASFTLTVAVSFPHPLVGTQVVRYADSGNYADDIAPARTFGFIEEVEALRKAGLALGGTLENAVVVYPDHYSVPLRFEDELARHKLLDVLGDLYLSGFPTPPQADIIAVKPSHRLNVAFAARLAELLLRFSGE